MALEKVVRPYQLREQSFPTALQVPSQVDPLPVIVQVGKSGGSPKVLNGSYTASGTYYLDKAAVERGG